MRDRALAFYRLGDFYAAGLYSDRSLSSQQRNWYFEDTYWPNVGSVICR